MKFPMWKLFLFVSVVLVSFGVLSVLDTGINPTISAQLAVSQLDDTESSAIAMRTYDKFQSNFPLGVWGFTVFVGLCLMFGTALFRADLVQLLTGRSNNEIS